MQVDWAGETILLQDSVTGEQSAAYLFVAVLPCSYYTYAEHHWVLASEKPYESVYKFYPPARSCTQTNSTPSPHTAPVAARNALVWARSRRVSTDARPAIYRPKFPIFEAFLPKNGFSCAGVARTGFTWYRKSLHK